jgi:sigma-B regulation protein RsbU (phosphoserine phosphatase)
MVRGESGLVQTVSLVTGTECWLAYAPLGSTGWSLGVFFPRDELMADLLHLNHIAAAIAAAGFLLLLIVVIAIAGTITRPLRLLAGATRTIGTGDLDVAVPDIRSRDEVGDLATAITSMRDALRQYIHDLTEATAARERIESELTIAHDIQLSIVRRVPAEFTDRTDFDLDAVLEPAREVGGDLYDFFFVGPHHLCIVMGDVCGKGVPSALLMAETLALVRMAAKACTTPDGILDLVNQELARDNDACMFVTIFCAVIDTRTGSVSWANAGHNPPLLIKPGAGVSFLPLPKRPPVAIDEQVTYPREELVLEQGDALFLYTDGVTEAFNTAEEQFSDERLQALLAQHQDDSSSALVELTLKAVRAFAAGQEQSDDITLLVLRFTGTPPAEPAAERTLTLRAEHEEMRRLAPFLAEFAAEHALSLEFTNEICLALEEIVANVINHGAMDGGPHTIVISLAHVGAAARVVVSDDTSHFNPLDVPAPDTQRHPDERPIGGLGIFLAREMMDTLEYTWHDERNILTLTKRLPTHPR